MVTMPFDSRSQTASPPAARGEGANKRAVAYWLLAMAASIWVMIALGGATRLTGSGLSIMEWAPFRGMLPPLTDAEWHRLYALYRTIPQYELVNAGFGIEGFKRIFWLEWTHRFWGRMIGLAYLLPFLWFWWRGAIPRGLMPRLGLLFVLGGMQGAIGWFMVASGFEADRTTVSPYRLVVHLVMALLLFAAILWTALDLLRGRPAVSPAGTGPSLGPSLGKVRRQVVAAFWLAALTMLAGGFVAGLRAGFTYNTFPLMDGQLVPEGYLQLNPVWRNLTANIAAVQFNHRLLATLTGLATIGAAIAACRRLPDGFARRAVLVMAGAVAAQYALGIVTLLHVVPPALGTAHQALAAGVLAAGLCAWHALREPIVGAPAA
jgi:cytochrome c oxidase assembly protein subunit 15